MRSYLLLLLALFFVVSCAKTPSKTAPTKPTLVVGIVVDQMRYDYLTRFKDRFGEGGFNRLLNNGFNAKNTHYNFIPTYTAVGHSSIFTGAYPSSHGIIGNDFYDKYLKQYVYCATDTRYTSVGVSSDKGQKSPSRMLNTTIGDQLHLAQNMRGKTIGIAIKDRSAIFPAGHTANGAYWYTGGLDGKWITSSFYREQLPTWVEDFNRQNKAADYLSKDWTPLYPIDTYVESLPDDNPYEGVLMGEEKPIFPHKLPELFKTSKDYSLIIDTPFGNSLTLDFAKAAIIGEELGKDSDTDFLSISFSSTDYVGHKFGPKAIETEDTYLRLDKDLEALLHFLDKEVGDGNYIVFLTADHAASDVPQYLVDHKIPAGYFDYTHFKNFINQKTLLHFSSDKLIEHFSNYQIYLNRDELKRLGLSAESVASALAKEAIHYPGIHKTITAATLQNRNFTSGILSKVQNGFNQKWSGDVVIVPNPSTISRDKTGTTHGSGYSYDTHVPLLFYGPGIAKGSSHKTYHVVDIAPTLASLLAIEFPNGNDGFVIKEALEK